MSATLQVKLVSSSHVETRSVRVVVSVLDRDLETVAGPESFLVAEAPSFPLRPGVYVVHVDPPSGERLRQTVTVSKGQRTTAWFHLHSLSGHETLEKTALLRGVDRRGESPSLDDEPYASAWTKLWRREPSDDWLLAPFAPESSWNDRDGVRYEFDLPRTSYFLQVGGPHVAWRNIAIPAHAKVTVTVLPDADRPGEVVAAAVTGNDDAESLLGYLKTGNIENADTVLAKAEHLLFAKFDDPIAATIAGYYLLRVRRLGRLRDWAPNLARHFTWLPDGPVINAWQHIASGRGGGGDTHYDEAREQLLLAASRGVPVYTEGLRLLVDGLALFASPGDHEVRAALTTVGRYADAVDWTATTVTFTGIDPERPDPIRRFGMPPSTAGMVFLQRVDLADLIRTRLLEPDTMVRFVHAPRVLGTVTASGRLRLASGESFGDPDEAAKAAPAQKRPWLGWYDWRVPRRESLRTIADASRSASMQARLSDPIDRLGLSARTTNALANAGLSRVRHVVQRYDSLRAITGIGKRSIQEISSSLAASELPRHR
jgi:hypothetical protein